MDAPRPLWDAERPGLRSHAERGYDQLSYVLKAHAGLHKERARRTHIHPRIVVAGAGEILLVENVLHPRAQFQVRYLRPDVRACDDKGPMMLDIVDINPGTNWNVRLASEVVDLLFEGSEPWVMAIWYNLKL
jgi:hypothetical protein